MVVCTTAQGRKKAYEFEKIFPPDTTQEEVCTRMTVWLRPTIHNLIFIDKHVFLSTVQVFQDTKPIITSCVDGYNVCIIAYGQTGAGKTYTMMGTPDRPGVNIR